MVVASHIRIKRITLRRTLSVKRYSNKDHLLIHYILVLGNTCTSRGVETASHAGHCPINLVNVR